jgi:hypothetical protein
MPAPLLARSIDPSTLVIPGCPRHAWAEPEIGLKSHCPSIDSGFGLKAAPG